MVPPGAPQAPPQQIEREPSRDRLIRYLAERTAFGRRASSFAEVLRGRVVPTHWSNLFGIVTMACLAVLFVTGLFLMFFYSPSSTIVEYRGGYSPLQGIELSRALDSTLHISFECSRSNRCRPTAASGVWTT
jgi:ubiquinol-cytochrome c reductase cytochrome b subunit